MKFNEKIVRLRKIRGITQDEFASAVGVSRQAVYKWESGHSYPEVAKLLEIKLLFNVSIDDLLDDNFDIAMPEKKKKKRLPKAEIKKIEEEVKREIETAKVEIPVAEENVEEAPAVEEVIEAAPVAVEAQPELTVTAPANEPAATTTAEEALVKTTTAAAPAEENAAEDKKRGFFGRLFGRK